MPSQNALDDRRQDLERAHRFEVGARQRELAGIGAADDDLDRSGEERHSRFGDARERRADDAQVLEDRLAAEERARCEKAGEGRGVAVGERRRRRIDRRQPRGEAHRLDVGRREAARDGGVRERQPFVATERQVAGETRERRFVVACTHELLERDPSFDEPLEERKAISRVRRLWIVETRGLELGESRAFHDSAMLAHAADFPKAIGGRVDALGSGPWRHTKTAASCRAGLVLRCG